MNRLQRSTPYWPTPILFAGALSLAQAAEVIDANNTFFTLDGPTITVDGIEGDYLNGNPTTGQRWILPSIDNASFLSPDGFNLIPPGSSDGTQTIIIDLTDGGSN
jgi:hypothetical protein